MFTDYYGRLQDILPVKKLSGHFISKRLINFEEEQIIQQSDRDSQAASTVLRKIAYSLRAGQTESFYKLLTIMRDHGGISCEELANQMRGGLSQNTSGTVTIAYCVIVMCSLSC